MTEPSPREKRLAYIANCIGSQAREMEMDWPKSRLDDPMLTGDRFILFKSRVADTAAMRQGEQIIMAMLVAADGLHALMTLAGTNRAAFDAIVNLAKQEIERADAPVQVAA